LSEVVGFFTDSQYLFVYLSHFGFCMFCTVNLLSLEAAISAQTLLFCSLLVFTCTCVFMWYSLPEIHQIKRMNNYSITQLLGFRALTLD